ncbi:UvrD-helicase domain-containing protein [Candidatus Avelusimicrobium facis]|uniref:UvrD-helicase domain-containing protein n=1 Tax=Candidatus Avelusimicrobium facis TaxID=3416203 RepID=UPI003D0FE3F3
MTQLTEDRSRVRTHLNVNMVVEAGAGTGKTTLLIDRLCFALLAQGIRPQRLVALTFTEKAAAEIKTRLIFKLQTVLQAARQNQPEPTLEVLTGHFAVPVADVRARAEQALALLDRSQIGTIHSFCADILRSFPLEAGLSPQAEIDKGPRAQHIFDAVWNRFLDEELGEQAPRAEWWKEVLPWVSLADLQSCAREMCSGKMGRYDYFARKDFLAQVCQERARRAGELSTAFLDGKKAPRVVEKALAQAARRFTQARQWLQTGQYTAPEPPEETIEIKSLPKDWDEESADQAKELCRFAAAADPAVQLRVLKAYELLQPLVHSVRTRYEQEGILSFDDLIVKTRDLLQSHLAVRHRLQRDYDALYIDEFQDTDPVQGELLLFLAERPGGTAATWQEVQLQPGKLFVVGDPKQSIYRFRGADITAYELFTRLILQQGGEKAYLRQNFRSEREIIAVANGVCSVVMKEKPAFQPAYEPIFTDKPEQNGAAQWALVCAGADKASADDYRHNQARFIVHWIEQNVGRLTLRGGRKLQYKDIALLSRAATTLGPYTDALRRAGIPFAVEEDRDFYTRQEVSDFLNFLRAAEDPGNTIALVGVLRSPWGALSDEELFRAAQRRELDYRKPSRDEKTETVFKRLRAFAARAGREPLGPLLRGLLNESFLGEACATAYDGERSLANLEKLVGLAEGYAQQTPATLGQFLARAEEIMQQEAGSLTAAHQTQTADAMSVMTVHKSKGLEFPVVILADISKKESASAAKRPAHLYSWRQNLHGLRVGKYADLNLAWLEEEQKEHARCEEVRVLYVALTRAREKLLVVGNEESDRRTAAELFMRAGYFPQQGERPAQVQGVQVHYEPYQNPAEFIYVQAAAAAVAPPSRDLAAWRTAFDQRMSRYRALLAQAPALSPSARVASETQYADAADLGTLCHRALADFWTGKQPSLAACVPGAAQQLQRPDLAAPAQEILARFEKSELFARWQKMQRVGVEMPFTLLGAEGELVNGVMDLLLKDEAGTVWVVDYKTDEKTDETAAQKYRPQLQVYQAAAQRMFAPAPVRSGIAFLRTGQWVESGPSGEIGKIKKI